MATVDLLASDVLDISAALLNDPNRTVYTYAAQLPYLKIALQELKKKYELNAMPVTQVTSAVIQVDAGETTIEFNAVGTPALPNDFISPQELWERNRDIDPYVPMRMLEYLPHYLEGVETNYFGFYTWNDNKISFLPSTADNDIKMDYIRDLFPAVVDSNSQINVINADTFLQYRTAALCAEFIERNVSSSNSLNAYAVMAMDAAIGIDIKGKQAIQTRRLPFRLGYKRTHGGWR